MNSQKASLISAYLLFSSTCVTNMIHRGKTVAEALWLLASGLLFLVSFHFFFCGVKLRKKWQEKGASWLSVSLVLICADLALQESLTSVTHTSLCRRSRVSWRGGEWRCEKEKQNSNYHSTCWDVIKVCYRAQTTCSCLTSARCLLVSNYKNWSETFQWEFWAV